MENQDRVAAFVDEHDLSAPPEYRLLDLVAEVGEIAANVTASTRYGVAPADLAVDRDELGDALFALLAFAEGQDIDAGEALEESLAKYERRLETGSGPGSTG